MVSTIIIDRMRQHSSLNGQVQVLVINRHVSFFWTFLLGQQVRLEESQLYVFLSRPWKTTKPIYQ